ncbi:MAG: type II toxin-antitoxin system HicA family toxin [Dehalococcoidia bacterium]|nr:type II toxin-antitoxin system HicA family toxin [Dehalococcoidia bacterium]
MKFSKNVWAQLKNKTADELVSALEKDGFALDNKARTERIYRHPDRRRVSIHYHTGNRGYQSGLLKALLKDIGWTENDMRRLKLIK